MLNVQLIKSNILNVKNNNQQASRKVMPNFTSNANAYMSSPLKNYLDAQAVMNKTMVKTAPVKEVAKVTDKKIVEPEYKNNLKSMLQNNEAKILAIVPRTFNAKDENGDEKITGNEQHGTFLNAIERLDEIQA